MLPTAIMESGEAFQLTPLGGVTDHTNFLFDYDTNGVLICGEMPAIRNNEQWKDYGVLARRVELTDDILDDWRRIARRYDEDETDNGMTNVFTGLQEISHEVRELVLQSACLYPMGDTFRDWFQNLELLDIDGSDSCPLFSYLPMDFPLTLKTLRLNGLSVLVELPSSIGELSNLTELNISFCPNITIPAHIPNSGSSFFYNLTALTTLHLVSLSIDSIPYDNDALPNLRDLCIADCAGIRTLPLFIWRMTSLRKMRLQGLNLSSRLVYCSEMHKLIFRNRSGLAELTSLTTLCVDKLEYITLKDDDISVLVNLEELSVMTVDALDFPVSFKKIRHIKKIELNYLPRWEDDGFTLFKSFAGSLQYLEKLEHLRMNNTIRTFVCPRDSLLCIATALLANPPPGMNSICDIGFPLNECKGVAPEFAYGI